MEKLTYPGWRTALFIPVHIEKFVAKITPKNKIAIVTHNVVIRALIGKALDLPIHVWFKLNPGHLEIHKFNNILAKKLV